MGLKHLAGLLTYLSVARLPVFTVAWSGNRFILANVSFTAAGTVHDFRVIPFSQ